MGQKKEALMGSMNRRDFLKSLGFGTAALAGCGTPGRRGRDRERPNILFAISDDQSWPHCGAYGDRGVKTPAFDRCAREGVLFSNAYVAAPSCAPSRGSVLTGLPFYRLGPGCINHAEFPRDLEVYPEILERAGYFTGSTGKGWGPGNWRRTGRPHNPAGKTFNRIREHSPSGMSKVDYAANFAEFLKARPGDKPFCFWYGAMEPHRPYPGLFTRLLLQTQIGPPFRASSGLASSTCCLTRLRGSALRVPRLTGLSGFSRRTLVNNPGYKKGIGLARGKKLFQAKVPGFLPDVPEVRSDILDYYVEIEHFDAHLGRMLALLEKEGLLENTLVIVTGDNGMPFPRAKANCYEYGVHCPLAIRWPARVPGGRVVEDVVSYMDLAPTILEAAGESPPEGTAGRSLLGILLSGRSGRTDPSRNTAVFGKERHHPNSFPDDLGYAQRGIRLGKYIYIRNYRPDRPASGAPPAYADTDGCPTKTYLLRHREEPSIRPFFLAAFGKRPAEELFDLSLDPFTMRNLAGDPARKETLERCRKALDDFLRRTGDPRALGKAEILDGYCRAFVRRPSRKKRRTGRRKRK